MSINVTITAESAQQLAEQLVTMAFLVAPNLREKLGTSTAVPMSAEPVAETKKPRGGRKPAQTIEHDEKETADVRTAGDVGDNTERDADGGSAGVAAETGGNGGAGAGGGAIAEGEAEEPATNDTPAEVDVVAKSEPPLSYDDVRAHVINDYLNPFFKTQEERGKAFRALLDEFQADSMKTLPAEKLGAVKARVDALIAEKAIV